MSIGSIFKRDTKLSNIEASIDNILDKISSIDKSDKQDHIEETGNLLNSIIDQDSNNQLQALLEKASVSTDRLKRYEIYDEINGSISIIKRIFRVYTTNVLQKNPVDGKCLLYKLTDFGQDEERKSKKAQSFVETVVKKYNIVKKLKTNFILNFLLYGDNFIEVINIDDYNIDVKKIKNNNFLFERQLKDAFDNESTPTNRTISNIVDCILEVDELDAEELRSSSINDDDDDFNIFKNILLKIHSPKKIIKLYTSYGDCLGYLEVVKSDTIEEHNSVATGLTNIIGKITNKYTKISSDDEFVKKIINEIIKKVLEKNKVNPKTFDKEDESIFLFFKKVLINEGYTSNNNGLNKVKVRFINANSMVNMSIPSNEFFPYGESIVDNLVFPSKLYLLAQLSNIITKLSRASLIRKWTIDSGPLQMQSSLIQKMKRELYNTRISVSDLSSFKSIPKILSDFKDMFVLSKNGVKPLDVEVQSFGDPAIKIADLEDARREIISLSGVPAPYLGYTDVVELREQLIHINISFATEISDLQENISNGLNELMDIIAEKIGIKDNDERLIPSNYVEITLIPPVVLILQLIEMTLSSVGNIIGIFQQMNIPFDPYHLLEKYIPYIDWVNFKSLAEKFLRVSTAKAKLKGQGQEEEENY